MAPRSVPEVFQSTVAADRDTVALRTKGDATVFTWGDYAERVEALAGGLHGLGVRKGDSVATQLSNRAEFHFVDMAAAHLGAIPFGVYNTSPPAQIVDRLSNADCRVIVTEQALLPAVREAAELYGRVEQIVCVDGPAEGTLTLEDVEAAATDDFDFEATWRSVDEEDTITIIYTSGTTGPPKGAQWNHGMVVRFLESFGQALPHPTAEVSYLPMAHAGERTLTHYLPLASGTTVTICPVVKEVLDHVADAHPDVLITVPLTWSKLKSAILAAVDASYDKAELEAALAVGLERVELDWAGEPVPAELADGHKRAKAAMRTRILERFGLDRVRYGITGGAPPPSADVKFFHAIGILLLEAYGLTEGPPFAVLSRLDDYKYGRAGKPIPGLEVRIADDGEILLRSRMSMVGYRKEPEATAAAIDPDGWLHTGDIGRIDEDGHLQVVDRKKALIINANGKNMSPANIENEIKRETPVIGQILAIGDKRPHNVALITLDPERAAIFARDKGLADATSVAELARNEAVLAEVRAAIERGNARLSRVERVRNFTVLEDEWVPDSVELTPTLKTKRKPIEEKYANEIEALYAG